MEDTVVMEALPKRENRPEVVLYLRFSQLSEVYFQLQFDSVAVARYRFKNPRRGGHLIVHEPRKYGSLYQVSGWRIREAVITLEHAGDCPRHGFLQHADGIAVTFIPDNDREERAVAEEERKDEARGTWTPTKYVINFRGPGVVCL